MPSHSILPESRRAAIEAEFDEALAEVRATADVALLQECRAIFRARVPFNLRAYVAAALALKYAGGSRQPEKRSRDGKGGRGRAEGRPDNRAESVARQPAKQAKPKKEEKPAREPEAKEPREVRENRYRGEGVTLFVSAGRRQRFYARVAVKMLLDIPGVADEQVGDVRTMDNYSFIVVDPAVEDAVIAALNGYDLKGRTLAVNRARKRGEPAPAREPRPMDSIGEEPVESPSEGSFDTGADGSGDSAYADDGDELDDDGLEPFGAAPEDEPEAATDGDEPEGEPDGEDTTEGA
ncbi:MAG TPA: DbpA RNA binding domain-containing protein [Spirochaetia bacterium]|nr:DbpA RNA binding domain-containing protein [Spirochaetia bacterium]